MFAGGEAPIAMLDWDSLAGVDTEERLSQLTRWCLDAAAEGRSFGMKLPGEVIGVGSGDRHLHRCLAALALYPAAAGSNGARA